MKLDIEYIQLYPHTYKVIYIANMFVSLSIIKQMMIQLDNQTDKKKKTDTIMLKLNYSVIQVWNDQTFL